MATSTPSNRHVNAVTSVRFGGGEPVHIAIDAVGAKHGGAQTVATSLVAAACCNRRVKRVTAFCSPASVRTFDYPRHSKLRTIDIPHAESEIGRVAWAIYGLASKLESIDADAVVLLSGCGLSTRGTPAVAFVQQSLFFSLEGRECFSASRRLRLLPVRALTHLSAFRASVVVVQTDTMRRWVSDGFGIDSSRIETITPNSEPFPESGLENGALGAMRTEELPTILYVGNAAPHKNLGILPRAIDLLAERGLPVRAYVTLPPEHDLCRSPFVVGLGRLDRFGLGQAYRQASLLVMPSIVETVGLPLVEAASFGLPTVAADRPYAREICGPSAIYFDPLSSASLASAIESLLSDKALGLELRQRALAISRLRTEAHPYERFVDVVLNTCRSTCSEIVA